MHSSSPIFIFILSLFVSFTIQVSGTTLSNTSKDKLDLNLTPPQFSQSEANAIINKLTQCYETYWHHITTNHPAAHLIFSQNMEQLTAQMIQIGDILNDEELDSLILFTDQYSQAFNDHLNQYFEQQIKDLEQSWLENEQQSVSEEKNNTSD